MRRLHLLLGYLFCCCFCFLNVFMEQSHTKSAKWPMPFDTRFSFLFFFKKALVASLFGN